MANTTTPKVKKVTTPVVSPKEIVAKPRVEDTPKVEKEVVTRKEEKKIDASQAKKTTSSPLEIIQLPEGKHELRLKTERGFKVLKKGSFDKCQNYLRQLQK